jgi:hypothetical protein
MLEGKIGEQGQPEAASVIGFGGESMDTGTACYDCTASGCTSVVSRGRDYI